MIDTENLPYNQEDQATVVEKAERIVDAEARRLETSPDLGYLAIIASPTRVTDDNVMESMYTNIHGSKDDV